MNLVEQGSEAAEFALVKLERQAKLAKSLDVRAALTQIKISGAVPVDLHPMAQWKMDSFGFVALELLLWVWRERTQPQRWRVRCLPNWRGCARWQMLESLFDRQSENHWWFLARHAFRETYPYPERLSEFKSLITAQAIRRSERLIHSYIVNRIHQRFRAFSAPLGQ